MPLLFVCAVVSPAPAGLILAASVGLRGGRALPKRYEKPANLDLRVSRDEVTQTVDQVRHKKPAAPDRFVDKSATRPRDRSALPASLGGLPDAPKARGRHGARGHGPGQPLTSSAPDNNIHTS